MRKRYLAIMLCLLYLLSGCRNAGAEITCTLAVHSDEKTLFAEAEVTFNEGETVLNILQQAMREAGIQMEYTGVGAAAYVVGIDNLYEFDHGPESGWLYSVNGEVLAESAGAYRPADGDALVWQYVLEQ